MPRLTIVPTAIAAVLVAASPAVAAPVDAPVDRTDRFQLETPLPKHDLNGPPARDALWRTVLPGPPTWPVDPEPLTGSADATPVADDGTSGWLLAGIGLAGAGIAAGGAAGVARRYRIRARRVAV